MADYIQTHNFTADRGLDADPDTIQQELALVAAASLSKADKTGATFTGAINVPANATGTQAPQAQEVFLSAHLPATTRMLFAQAAAPVGWTQDITAGVNDRMLRMVNTSGNGMLGTDSPITGITLTATDAHTLLISEIPSHTHSYTQPIGTKQGGGGISGASGFKWPSNAGATVASGGGAAHSHTITGGNWSPKYIDIIVCSKD